MLYDDALYLSTTSLTLSLKTAENFVVQEKITTYSIF